ncbi:hypothetical protein BH24CHL9_BH24CHL9_11870 [soil metagenome]
MRAIICRAPGGLAFLIVLLLGLVAVTDAADDAGTRAEILDRVELLDFTAIQAGPLVLAPDPGGRSATMAIGTTTDVACAVVYGTDETFGSIATDADMGGGAHRDHEPVLSGLEPDTEYRYRVQGSDADGRLYVSETFSFRTPPAPIGVAADVALGAGVVEVSSEFSAAYGAANARDGDPSTECSSAGDGDDAFITIDLGEERDIGAVAFVTRSMADGSSVTETFSVSVDGVEHGPFPAGSEQVEVALRARVLRFDVVSSSGGNTGAVDIEVHAAE